MRTYPTHFQVRTLWNAATGFSILVLGALLTGFIYLTGSVLGFLQPVVVPLAVAGIVAYLLDPVVVWFQKRGLSRMRAVISTFGLFTLLAAILISIMIPLVGSQIAEFRRQKASQVENGEKRSADQAVIDILIKERNTRPWTQPMIDPLLSAPDDLENPNALRGEELSDALDLAFENKELKNPHIEIYQTKLWSTLLGFQDEVLGWIEGGTTKVFGYIGLIIGFMMVPIYLFFFLKESAAIKEHWHEYVPLKASRFKTELVETLTEVNGYLISFFRGQVLVAFIDGIFIAIGLWLFGLPLSMLIGLLMAIVGIIPFVGNIITLIPACIIAYFHFSVPENQTFLGDNPWAYVAGVGVIFFIAQQINSIITAPKIVGDSVGLHPMTVIFSMIFWSLILGGFVGALLAVPLTAAVKVLLRRYFWERKIKAVDKMPDDELTDSGAEAEPA
ncbi:AI-2E family transporter [Haloferula rosea]|uniref:AI-2E family transporter n=1 Tax=Haloferula rosea TaxID=490093 RepID=A0A934VE70_9BACT|nr:AI-2E family transporter [Haloferula rosea]MBK1826999.1 AI-2E family transporter [Haloferula rosea]